MTLLADCIGPINNPKKNEKIKKFIFDCVKIIKMEKKIRHIKEKEIVFFELYLSLKCPPKLAPIRAATFIKTDIIKSSFIDSLNTPTAKIPPMTKMVFKPSA
jgi:hypothetical protein